AALPAADDDAIGLHGSAQRRCFAFPAVKPVLAMLERAVHDAGRTRGAGRLLMTLEVQHGGEQRQAALALEAQMANAARQRRLEPEPGLDGAIDLGRLIDQRPAA